MNKPAVDYRSLSVAERIQLVEDIWDSIAVEGAGALPLTPAERAELNRRLEAHDADPSRASSWEALRAALLRPER